MHAAILTAFFFALTGICATQASRLLGAARANAWRLMVALLLLSLWVHLFGEGWGARVLLHFPGAGAIGFGLGGWFMFQALSRIGSTLSLLIVECGATVFASAIGWIWLDAALTLREMLFIVLILSGIILGMSPGPLVHLERKTVWTGVFLALTAALFQAISFNLSRAAFLRLGDLGESIDPISAAYQRLLGGAVIAVLLYFLTGRRQVSPSGTALKQDSPLPAPLWVLGNALSGPVLGVTCMLWAISLVANPGLVQAVAATATLLTVPLAYFLEKARPGPTYYLGCLMALAGVAGLLIR